MKERNVVLSIVLSIITCGIYAIYWQIVLVDDFNRITEDDNSKSGLMVLLLSIITCGIYWIYWLYCTGNKIDKIDFNNNKPVKNKGFMYLILSIFGLSILSMAMLQNDINEFIPEAK